MAWVPRLLFVFASVGSAGALVVDRATFSEAASYVHEFDATEERDISAVTADHALRRRQLRSAPQLSRQQRAQQR